jgi:hypothetical protein
MQKKIACRPIIDYTHPNSPRGGFFASWPFRKNIDFTGWRSVIHSYKKIRIELDSAWIVERDWLVHFGSSCFQGGTAVAPRCETDC